MRPNEKGSVRGPPPPSSPEPSPSEEDSAQSAVDFDEHRRQAVDRYETVRALYEECALSVRSVMKTVLTLEGLTPVSIEARAKDIESFGRKSVKPADNDPHQPKYPAPLDDITDLAGVRVIVFLLAQVDEVNKLIEREFAVVERVVMSGLSDEANKAGYQSVHYLVRFSSKRCELPEYQRFTGRVTEIQVRTILQHAWAEIEHESQYKAESLIPAARHRRFLSLAGTIELADREFQAIWDDNDQGTTE